MILLSIAAALACGCSGRNSGGPALGALTFHEYQDFNQAQTMFGSLGFGYVDGKKPAGYTAPKGALGPAFVSIRIGRGTQTYVGVLAKSSVAVTEPDLMWVDWNGDKKFENDERATVVKGAGVQGRTVFKPVSDPKIGGHVVHLAFTCVRGRSIAVVPSGYMEGTVELNGKSVKVGIIDANGNGVYGDKYTLAGGGDLFLIDRKGTGKFDMSQPTSTAAMFEGDVLPLFGLMQLGEAGLCEISVTDGARIAITPYAGATGDIVFQGASGGFVLADGPKGTLFVQPSDGKCKLPAGAYSVQMMEYKLTDSAGKDWTFDVQTLAGKKLQVAADTPVLVKCGPPLAVTLSPSSMHGVQMFSLDIKDASGASLSGLSDAQGGRPAAPKLTIADSKGKVVKTLAFSYG